MKRLLLIPCSATKRRHPRQRIAALDRYDGVFYRVIRKALRESRLPRNLRIAIISARFGLITDRTRIPFYDLKMSPLRAAELRPRVQAALRRLLRHRFDQMFINLGRNYLSVVDGVPDLRRAVFASGPIGKRARALKEWIDSAHDADLDQIVPAELK